MKLYTDDIMSTYEATEVDRCGQRKNTRTPQTRRMSQANDDLLNYGTGYPNTFRNLTNSPRSLSSHRGPLHSINILQLFASPVTAAQRPHPPGRRTETETRPRPRPARRRAYHGPLAGCRRRHRHHRTTAGRRTCCRARGRARPRTRWRRRAKRRSSRRAGRARPRARAAAVTSGRRTRVCDSGLWRLVPAGGLGGC